jgi:hypothetical protein
LLSAKETDAILFSRADIAAEDAFLFAKALRPISNDRENLTRDDAGRRTM